ncbi:hypothetical protein ACE1TI_11435 [Alteribacillus sp. JSM 102045]
MKEQSIAAAFFITKSDEKAKTRINFHKGPNLINKQGGKRWLDI